MAKQKSSYPDTYGTPIKGAQSDMLSPICMDAQGDLLVPPNDMKAVGGRMGDDGFTGVDPLSLLKPFGDGTKE